MPGKYPEDNLSLQQHGESLKTRTEDSSPLDIYEIFFSPEMFTHIHKETN
jgi:hypothetical protein